MTQVKASHLNDPLGQEFLHWATDNEVDLTPRTFALSSAFQPIISLLHMRSVGYEALMRITDRSGSSVPPAAAFKFAAQHNFVPALDIKLTRRHVRNFERLQMTDEWLFINIHPETLISPRGRDRFVSELLGAGIAPGRIVVEIVEDPSQNDVQLSEAADSLKNIGFLIALDDFGSGHSNIDRVWLVNPDIVKLDRRLVSASSVCPRNRRNLRSLVALLHEAECLVVIEGVETESEALIAFECDADFVQGYCFGLPTSAQNLRPASNDLLSSLSEKFQFELVEKNAAEKAMIMPYVRAFQKTIALMQRGEALRASCIDFLSLDRSARMFELDATGTQIGNAIERIVPKKTEGYSSLFAGRGVSWMRRGYFRNALLNPGQLHVSAPYLSFAAGSNCMTLSFGLVINKDFRVICADVDAW